VHRVQNNQKDMSGGVSVADFYEGKANPRAAGKEPREHACPLLWYQSVDYEKIPRFKGCPFGQITSCDNYPKKAECWKRWDEEQLTEMNMKKPNDNK